MKVENAFIINEMFKWKMFTLFSQIINFTFLLQNLWNSEHVKGENRSVFGLWMTNTECHNWKGFMNNEKQFWILWVMIRWFLPCLIWLSWESMGYRIMHVYHVISYHTVTTDLEMCILVVWLLGVNLNNGWQKTAQKDKDWSTL